MLCLLSLCLQVCTTLNKTKNKVYSTVNKKGGLQSQKTLNKNKGTLILVTHRTNIIKKGVTNNL